MHAIFKAAQGFVFSSESLAGMSICTTQSLSHKTFGNKTTD